VIDLSGGSNQTVREGVRSRSNGEILNFLATWFAALKSYITNYG
jgi:hypothetical protein